VTRCGIPFDAPIARRNGPTSLAHTDNPFLLNAARSFGIHGVHRSNERMIDNTQNWVDAQEGISQAAQRNLAPLLSLLWRDASLLLKEPES
jgi:hypothetical protein